MNSQEIRDKFLRFFEKRGHKAMPSSSLIPEDKTVLFTTAGMQQFKKYYLNPKEAPASRITTVQKCLRTSDIEEVGDKTHLTFFEMMGNFSFNDYFKEETINWGWEFLTDKEWLGIDKKRISATYFEGDKEKEIPEDRESLNILKKIDGLSKIKPQGFKDNFWSLGIEGSPGGPTVEFYVDGVEIWNLVFNEYIFENGKYNLSKFKGVDTGMGLERLVAIMQKKDSVFETDLLKPIYDLIEKEFDQAPEILRKITDHIKASCFLISEGSLPSNLDRGYVLRRLLRRTIIYANLTSKENWYIEPVKKTIETHKDVYPDLKKNEEKIITVIQNEEEKFGGTVERGLKYISSLATKFKEFLDVEFIGKQAFTAFESYGIPPEMFLEELKKIGVTNINEKEFWKYFDKKVKEHQKISRKGAEKKFKGGLADESYETTKLHTTAHLLLQALREVLGEHVVQKGSNITAERLRFDFSHPEKLSQEQIEKVEDLVNQKIKDKLPVSCQEITLEEAKKQGAMGVFEERYGDKVKVYSVGSFSREICGGPHIKNTSELGEFKIKKEESVGAGIRRIKAVLL